MPWKSIKRDCTQKTTGKKGSYAVVKKKEGGGEEQVSCHTSEEKAKGSIAAKHIHAGKTMKITRGQLSYIIQEYAEWLSGGEENREYSKERWQQELLNKVRVEKRLKQLQPVLKDQGIEIIVITDEESTGLNDNEIRVIVNKQHSGVKGMFGGQANKEFKFFAWPNGITVKDELSGEESISLKSDGIEGWIWDNVIEESNEVSIEVMLNEGVLDWVQGGLDVVGLIPGIGEAADAINARY